ncbi:SMRP1 protein, partial [Bucco capensis]|nr:SMRP1 protein [Bucco capensis]
MFLISKKHKTPVSTYSDSYCLPYSDKKTTQEQTSEQLWKEDKFLTQGLMMPPVQSLVSQGQPEQMIALGRQGYYRKVINFAAGMPKNYWLDRSQGKYNPIFINENKYVTWRTGPYNSAAWSKHSSYLPLLPKETRMGIFLHSTPVPYPLKLTCVSQSEREAVTNMLNKQPVYTMRGREPFQGYYSPSSGRHYFLQGMDYYTDGTAGTRRSVPCCSYTPRAMFFTSTHYAQSPSLNHSAFPRWNMSHFMKAGQVQRDSYIIHPEFVSEDYSA